MGMFFQFPFLPLIDNRCLSGNKKQLPLDSANIPTYRTNDILKYKRLLKL